MERVIIDMDEVIADPMGEMIRWYEEAYGQVVDKSRMRDSWIRGFPDEHQVLVRERLMSPGFFRNLPVMEHSVDVLREMNDKYELYIVSAAMEFPHSLKDKLDWLLENFPFLTWQQLVLCGDKKLITGDYMIDDHVRNLIHFPGKKYLFSSAHNSHITDYDRINDWQEAREIFL